MLFWILAVAVPIYAGALYISYQDTARRLEAGAQHDADAMAARLAAGLDAVIRPIEGGIRTVAYQLEEVNPPPAEYLQRIRGILAAWPEVYGSTIAVDVVSAAAGSRPFAPYLFRRGGETAFSDLASESYTYSDQPWYRRAADSGQPVWSAPYFDTGGGETWMVTYSVPFYRKRPGAGRVLAGVVTADLDLNWVRRTAAGIPLGPADVGWLSSPPAPASFVAPIGDTANRLVRARSMNPESLRDVGDGMLKRNETFALLPPGVTARPAYLAVRTLRTLDWRLMLVLPRDELLTEARALLTRQLWLGALGLATLIGAISLVAAGVTRPIRALSDAVGQAREEHLAFHLPEAPGRDEVGVLTDALRRLRDSLTRHIQLRAESLAERARLEHELKIAASIQQSMLPQRQTTAALPSAARIAAALLPAKQVGGDVYDYFERRDGTVLFAIGDVSDKGIPAALFMARLSALLRLLGAQEDLPDRLLAGINARLVDGNDACMFVTLGCGLLNVETGRVQYASAGHEPPLVRQVDGTVRQWIGEGGPAIGIDAGGAYHLREGFVAPGDTLVLFTDGVTDAEGEDGSFYGLDRLCALVQTSPDGDPAALVQRIVETVAAHASGFQVTDDLTVMAVCLTPAAVTARRDPGGERWVIEPEPSPAGVLTTQRWLRAILASRGVVHDRICDVEVIAEELLANVVQHGGEPAGHLSVSIECALTPSDIALTFGNNAPRFNPLEQEDPRLDTDIADRQVGGLGILLVKQLASASRYAHVDGRNVLEIRVRRAADPS